MIEFTPVFWYWFVGIVLGFLPLELAAAFSKGKLKNGTFSEFVWWSFGVRRHPCGECARFKRLGPCPLERPPFAPLRRAILSAFCLTLTAHFVVPIDAVWVVVSGVPVAAVLIRAIGWERS